ncbi:hypothetical protein AD998_08540 [bacterium 336/3]|nr:hypothetical protein AD998_08540 [bacterium 336/3]
MGLWTNGDYKIYVELSVLEADFRDVYKSYINVSTNRKNMDTVTVNLYKATAERYLFVAEQLKVAKNGFDLRNLVIYFGLDNEQQNKGDSFIVESYIRQLVERGNAALFYKGNRIFTLKKIMQLEGTGVGFGYEVRIYFDNAENYAFKYYIHNNW